MLQTIATSGTLAASVATAIATVFLWRVTKILAIETKRMADTAAQPQVVANIVPNKWSMTHFDLVVENTGNATAFEIEVTFDPPLENGEARPEGAAIPLQQISLLKPQQSLSSYLSEAAPILERTFKVTVTWKLTPESPNRQSLAYMFRMADYADISRLGAEDPFIQIAEQVKRLREDWRSVAQGQRKIKADVFSKVDRDNERALMEERVRAARARSGDGSS